MLLAQQGSMAIISLKKLIKRNVGYNLFSLTLLLNIITPLFDGAARLRTCLVELQSISVLVPCGPMQKS